MNISTGNNDFDRLILDLIIVDKNYTIGIPLKYKRLQNNAHHDGN